MSSNDTFYLYLRKIFLNKPFNGYKKDQRKIPPYTVVSNN